MEHRRHGRRAVAPETSARLRARDDASRATAPYWERASIDGSRGGSGALASLPRRWHGDRALRATVWNWPILLRNSNRWCSRATSEFVDLSEGPRIDDRHLVDGRRTTKNSSSDDAEEFFDRIGSKQPFGAGQTQPRTAGRPPASDATRQCSAQGAILRIPIAPTFVCRRVHERVPASGVAAGAHSASSGKRRDPREPRRVQYCIFRSVQLTPSATTILDHGCGRSGARFRRRQKERATATRARPCTTHRVRGETRPVHERAALWPGCLGAAHRKPSSDCDPPMRTAAARAAVGLAPRCAGPNGYAPRSLPSRPRGHPASLLEEVAAPVGCLRRVAYRVRERHLRHVARVVRALGSPVAERASKSMRHGVDLHPAQDGR